MSITNHVPSLDLCQELNKAGLKFPKSCFVWIGKDLYERGSYLANQNHWGKRVPAPLASEIGELLPTWVVTFSREDKTFCSRIVSHPQKEKWFEIAHTIPDAMAKMLLYLKEKGLL